MLIPTIEELDAKVLADTLSLRQEFIALVPLTPSQTKFAEWEAQGRIFCIRWCDQLVYPSFQFDRRGQPVTFIQELLAILRRDPELTDWDIALWFNGGTGWLKGRTPIECLHSDPQAVKVAATQEALRDER